MPQKIFFVAFYILLKYRLQIIDLLQDFSNPICEAVLYKLISMVI
jgi:hypothetical protein